MICEHLEPLEQELITNGIKEVSRGKTWSDNCREWVYYDCVFSDPDKTMLRLKMRTDIIKMHSHLGTHDGHEQGFVCTACLDAIMGIHPDMMKFSSRDTLYFE